MTIRTYNENPYLKEIKANVIKEYEENGKHYVILDRTIFYPHLSGGQPRDKGTINGIQVVNVYEDEESGEIIHVLEKQLGQDKADLQIDWNHRFDLMQQHTGQHLLSANLFSLYNAETDSFHFSDDHVSIEINKGDLQEKEVKQVEYLTNKIIQSNFKISSYSVDKEELKEIPLRKYPEIKDGEEIRIVEIEGIDYSLCCGTHLLNTGELGLIKVRKWQSTEDSTRIDFVCGNRALYDYGWKNKSINEISTLLSSKDTDIVGKTKDLINQKENLQKEIMELKEKMAELEGENLIKEANAYHGIRYIVHSFKDQDLKYINKISSTIQEEDNIIQIYSNLKEGEEFGQFLISKSFNLEDINLNERLKDLKEELDLKGGGSEHTIQGGASKESLDNLIRTIYSYFRNHFKKDEDLEVDEEKED